MSEPLALSLSLPDDGRPKSKAAAVRLLLDEIETALRGDRITQADIRQSLKPIGYEFSAEEFRNALHRARAARRKPKAAPYAPSQAPAPPAHSAAQPRAVQPGQPKQFDWQQHRDGTDITKNW